MSKDARVSWFVFAFSLFTGLCYWSIAQAWFVQDYRWLAMSTGCIGAMAMLLNRKDKHDELVGSVTRVSVQVTPEKPISPGGRHTVKLEIKEGDGNSKYSHLPLPIEDLRVIARATINGRAFSTASWCGNGRLLSRTQFEDLRDWLIKHGYAQWVDERNRPQGIVMTAKGDAVWRGLAN